MAQERHQFLAQLPPVFEAQEAHAFMRDYASPVHLLSRLVANQELIRLRRGLYTVPENIDHILIANRLVSPSYVSFESALAHYGMIPERVETTLSVTQHRALRYATPVGLFVFHEQNVETFASSFTLEHKETYSIRIATPEKALLDTLSRMRLRSDHMTEDDARAIVLEGLRIEEASLQALSIRELRRLVPFYTSRVISLFVQSCNKSRTIAALR